MNMKWSIAVLGLLGVAAAACAAVLVATLRADASSRLGLGRGARAPQEVEITMAAHDLPAMAVLDASGVTTKRVPRSEAPEHYFSQTFQVVGKVLAAPVLTGQVFRPASFIEEGTGQELAAALKDGMRAVSVSLPRDSGNDGILYPGSIVDVLVSLKLPGETSAQNEAISTTLLQGVQVLATEDSSIVSGSERERKSRAAPSTSSKRNVTLLVNAKQAVLLQLAREYGEISLAMRNPLDDTPADAAGVLLSELSPAFLKRLAKTAEPEIAEPTPTASKWEVEIFRGCKLEKRTLGVSEAPAPPEAAAEQS
jgi:Flp pilus assembly protein CpaB